MMVPVKLFEVELSKPVKVSNRLEVFKDDEGVWIQINCYHDDLFKSKIEIKDTEFDNFITLVRGIENVSGVGLARKKFIERFGRPNGVIELVMTQTFDREGEITKKYFMTLTREEIDEIVNNIEKIKHVLPKPCKKCSCNCQCCASNK